MTVLRRDVAASFVAVLGAGVAGAVLCLMKGEGGGLAMAVGNLVAPYFLVAVVAGLTAHRWWFGALLGVVATEATVCGFYGTWAAYFGHEVSQSALMLWGGAGILSGAFCGVIGSAARKRRGLRYVLPALPLIEPFVTQLALLGTSRIGIGTPGMNEREVVAYSLEIVVGAVVFLAVHWHLRTHRPRTGELAAA